MQTLRTRITLTNGLLKLQFQFLLKKSFVITTKQKNMLTTIMTDFTTVYLHNLIPKGREIKTATNMGLWQVGADGSN
jgi:hypothetical protein